MDDKMLKFYVAFLALVVGISYFASTTLYSVMGSIAFMVPGVVAVAGFWLAKKISGTQKV